MTALLLVPVALAADGCHLVGNVLGFIVRRFS